jgi:hypothetical protein
MPGRTRLFGQNDRSLAATWDRRFKLVGTPRSDGWGLALYDRSKDPGETRNVSTRHADEFRVQRRELDLFLGRVDREWSHIRQLLTTAPGEERLSPQGCEQLEALGYVQAGCPRHITAARWASAAAARVRAAHNVAEIPPSTTRTWPLT